MLGAFVTAVLGVLIHPTVLLLFTPILFRIVWGSLRRCKLARSHGCKSAQISVPLKDPFIGFDFLYDIFFSKTPDQYLESTWETFRKLGSTYTVKRWTWETIYTCDPQNIKKMLASGFQDFDLPEIRVSTMSPMFGQGIFTMTGQPWAHTRHFLRSCFTKPKLAPLTSILEGHFQALLNYIPANRVEVDLQPLFFALTTDIATEFLMGHSSGVLDPRVPHEDAQRFLDDYRTCSEEVVRQMQLGPLRHFRINAHAEIAKKRVFSFMDAFISEALDRSTSKHSESNLISELIGVTRDKKALRDQVLHVLLASRDTTAGLLSNLFFILAKNPKIYTRLRNDVLRVVGDVTPSMSQLREIEYLKWCVNESLRLHPVVPTNAREALRDTTLPHGGGGDGKSPLFVPKGTVVLYNVYSMHRDASVFGSKPEEFVPERWSNLRPGWAYLPFNGGPRICIGQQFALLECYYIIARMVQTFARLESTEEGGWVEHYALALSSKKGTRVFVER